MIIQKRLLSFLSIQKVWEACVHGGVPRRSIFTNAQPHVGRAMVANLDVKDFFPTTTISKVQEALERNQVSPDVAVLIAQLTTNCLDTGGERCLPQGAPTSTFLANLVFEAGDARVLRLCERHKLRYTRYVDDLTLSGDMDFRHLRGGLLQVILDFGYAISLRKVRFCGRNERQVVTGLVVNDRLRPTKEFVWELKRLIRECFWPGGVGIDIMAAEAGRTIAKLRARIEGRINHLRQFDRRKAREVRALMFPGTSCAVKPRSRLKLLREH